MMPGPKMIWQFGELGYDFSINTCVNGTVNPNCRLDPKPIRWDYYNIPERKKINQVISTIQNFKSKTNILSNAPIEAFIGEGFIKRIKYSTSGLNVVLIGNFDVTAKSAVPDFQHSGWWYDYLNGDSIQITDPKQIVVLNPGEYHFWTDTKISVAVDDHINKVSNILVYPNPFSQNVFIESDLEIKSIQVKDLTGKSISVLSKNNGVDSWELEFVDNTQTGLYLLEIIERNGGRSVIKLLKE